MYGRKRFFEGIRSKLPFIRAQAERMAINAPIQGTQADIIKIAMVRIADFLKKKKLTDEVKLVLQIHDEIIFEVEDKYVEPLRVEVQRIMEEVMTPEQTKGVPVLTNSSVGESWGEMK